MQQQHILARQASAAHCMRTLRHLALAAVLIAPCLALAQADGGLTLRACGFLNTVQKVLNAVSVVVVTIAVIFSGYQIAFAHKRIGDVAPIMVGALLIGAAGQIAKLFLPDGGKNCGTSASHLLVDPLIQFAGLAQSLAGHA